MKLGIVSMGNEKVKVNFRGGFLLTSDLRLLASAIYRSGSNGVYLGYRQEFIIPKINLKDNFLSSLSKIALVAKMSDNSQNIVCSNASGGLTNKTDWAYEQDSYFEIIRQLNSPLQLKVNICFAQQSFCFPLSGQVNFLVSQQENYWIIALRIDEQLHFSSYLIHSSSMVAIIDYLNENYLKLTKEILEEVKRKFIDKIIDYKQFILPYEPYQINEGFIPMGDKNYALNIVQSNQKWTSGLLEDISLLMTKQNLRRAYITCQKSLLIKHISTKDILKWKELLIKNSISIRHSEKDFLWFYNSSDLAIKRLRNRLNKALKYCQEKVLDFYISLSNENEYLPTQIVVACEGGLLHKTYRLSHNQNFDYRQTKRKHYEKLSFKSLVELIIALSRKNYNSVEKDDRIIYPKIKNNDDISYECSKCLSQYNEKYGCKSQNIIAGTSFDDLPDDWYCLLCNETKKSFQRIIKND